MVPASLRLSAPDEGAHSGDVLARRLAGRPELAARFAAARLLVARHVEVADADMWAGSVAALYDANAGPALLEALWSLETRLLPGTSVPALLALWSATRTLCRHAGAAVARRAVEAVAARVHYGEDGAHLAAVLRILAGLAERAADAVAPLLDAFDDIVDAVDASGLEAWIADGLALHPADRRRRAAYFRLADAAARQRLAERAGAIRYAPHEERLRKVTRALFGFEPEVRVIADRGLRRTRLAGGLLLMPARFTDLPAAEAPTTFEAAVLHAACHRAFTTTRFAVGRMKPVQLALVALLEDARVERLATRRYPGLARLWGGLHHAPASRIQTIPSLFARLARGLADPAFADGDGWIAKARRLFDDAFAADPAQQSFVPEIARVIGHDLGQLRIPFDAKGYVVQPLYRDDGLGLFDWAETDPENADALELMVEAARIREEEVDAGSSDAPAEPGERARAQPRAEDEEGTLIALHPEWHHRLRAEQPDHVTVRLYPAAEGATDPLRARLAVARGVRARIDALVRRARLDRPTRLRRRMQGDDLDLEAAQEAMQALRLREMPDPRIHMAKHRQGRDVALMLLLDISQSTADPVAGEGETVLSTAALSVALLGEALAGLGDPFAADAFASNGRADVRITPLKNFDERWEAALPRLAGLQPAYSTRLGAALRHGAARLASRAHHRRVLVVVTDGEPSDIDVEESEYLIEDAKHAVARARGQGLDVFCVALGEAADKAGAAMFGRRNTFGVTRVSELPQRLAALYYQLTVR
ncbi:VWA domain-containing protein [Ancylobacter sonchi]|uniref:VWA domain-containing protein n=1 Tax=Ancylobacter sonchi TaxID=1937790 RepID=UPI001BD2E965|nr:VWA domain-containing protein [Ancylobacter sonchi]MBS7534610.1 VWA domain-containing protein [Ancylobacter sonchi]